MTNIPALEFSPDTILAEHRELLESINHLRAAWNAGDAEAPAEDSGRLAGLRRLVERLRDDLASHFAAEERGGYMAHVLRFEPRFTPQAADLKSQHAEFLRMLDRITALLAEAAGSTSRLQQARQEFDRLVERLLEHEHAENDLVQFAFTTDIGPGD